MRGFTPMSEQREGIRKCRERKRGRGEKQISPRYTNLPESAHVAFDVSRNSQILSREPVRPMKPKEGKLFGRIEFVIAQQYFNGFEVFPRPQNQTSEHSSKHSSLP